MDRNPQGKLGKGVKRSAREKVETFSKRAVKHVPVFFFLLASPNDFLSASGSDIRFKLLAMKNARFSC